ncbi:MAG: tetratricopeptide repeat protein [Spirochaetaceae bacterium]|nr:tetratricopeptide repeat protein [Spirochaetaceae bacterium]
MMNNNKDSIDNLLWINLPEDTDTDMGTFTLNTEIPLPVEPDENGEVDITEVTWEKVIAASLLVLANNPSHEHAGYYRRFLLALRPGLPAELTEASRERINEADWVHAEDIILALRGLEPDSIEPRYAMARLYDKRAGHERKSGDPQIAESYEGAAEAAYNELLSEDSAPGSAWYDAGIFRYKRGDFLRAAETLESFLDTADEGEDRSKAERMVRLCRDEGQADELYREAYAALNAGQISRGISMAREFRDQRPEGWPGWFILGWGLRLSEEWQSAREALEGAQERGCKESDLYNELAICTRALKDFDASSAALEEALKHDPENIKIISNMAIVHLEKGNREEAVTWLQTALTMEPSDPVCLQLLDDLTT